VKLIFLEKSFCPLITEVHIYIFPTLPPPYPKWFNATGVDQSKVRTS